MADVLRSYLGEAGRAPFVWGELDCFLYVADWVERVTGIDPAGEYRGAYESSRQARNIIKANGGALAFAGALLARAGCVETSQPEIGDVALVRAAFRYRGRKAIFVPVGAICVRAGMWAIKTAETSLTMGDFPVVRAWKLPHA